MSSLESSARNGHNPSKVVRCGAGPNCNQGQVSYIPTYLHLSNSYFTASLTHGRYEEENARLRHELAAQGGPHHPSLGGPAHAPPPAPQVGHGHQNLFGNIMAGGGSQGGPGLAPPPPEPQGPPAHLSQGPPPGPAPGPPQPVPFGNYPQPPAANGQSQFFSFSFSIHYSYVLFIYVILVFVYFGCCQKSQ